MQKSKPIYQYDNITGKLIASFTSQSEAEQSLGLYRGAAYDILSGSCNRKGLLLSTEKYDVYPDLRTDIDKPILKLTVKPKEKEVNLTLSEKDLREKHDMYYIISKFVNDIPEGQYIEETAMLRHLSLFGKPRYREALTRVDKDNKGKVDGTVYYGALNSIRKLKQEGVLQ